MNLGNLKSRIRLLVPEATTTIISDVNLEALLNDGQLDVVGRTDCLQNYADQTVTATVQEYSIPIDCIKVLAVYYGGTGDWEKLPMVTMDYLSNQIDADWINDTGTTYAYYLRGDKIGLWQTPTASEAGTNYLRAFYIKQPDTLLGDTSIPFDSVANLYPYHELVYLYVAYKIKQMVGKWEQAKFIEEEYLAKCREMKVEINKIDDFQQPITPYYKGNGGASLREDPLDQS
jgi:hypothetical protein